MGRSLQRVMSVPSSGQIVQRVARSNSHAAFRAIVPVGFPIVPGRKDDGTQVRFERSTLSNYRYEPHMERLVPKTNDLEYSLFKRINYEGTQKITIYCL